MSPETKTPVKPILVVDDEHQFLYSITLMLRSAGISNVITSATGGDALRVLADNQISLLLLDINLPDIRGTEILQRIQEFQPDIPVIMISAINEAGVAVECMKRGALDYLVKPVDNARLLTTVRNALAQREISSENEALKGYLLNSELKHPAAFQDIITNNTRMHSLFQYVEAIAPTPFPVLLTGETGVGKELFAKAIHSLSGRMGSFVTINVAGIDDNVFSDTIFGHVKGAFTGADKARPGLIEQATGGTLFLDEIGDLSRNSQIKLLRVLQDRDYLPLGSDVPKLAEVRLIVATNKDIVQLRENADFRSDLFHRLRTHHVAIPPLRERMNDIGILTDHFLGEAAGILGKKKPTPPRELNAMLNTYSFPGNVRELRSMIFDAVAVHKEKILSMKVIREHIGLHKRPGDEASVNPAHYKNQITIGAQLPTIRDATRALIDSAITRSGGNQNIAARLLGISPQALSRRLKYQRRKNTR